MQPSKPGKHRQGASEGDTLTWKWLGAMILAHDFSSQSAITVQKGLRLLLQAGSVLLVGGRKTALQTHAACKHFGHETHLCASSPAAASDPPDAWPDGDDTPPAAATPACCCLWCWWCRSAGGPAADAELCVGDVTPMQPASELSAAMAAGMCCWHCCWCPAALKRLSSIASSLQSCKHRQMQQGASTQQQCSNNKSGQNPCGW